MESLCLRRKFAVESGYGLQLPSVDFVTTRHSSKTFDSALAAPKCSGLRFL